MRVAFYGGSFNPPHYGHFLACAWALCSGHVDEVWMVPCYRHAFGKKLAPYPHRVAMCERGASPLGPRLKISQIEGEIQAVSHTIDTIRRLLQRDPSLQLRLLVGTDILAEQNKWKEFETLLELAPLLLIGRAGIDAPEEITAQEPFRLPEISSSTIRQHLRQNQAVHPLLPQPTLDYIQEHNLYR